MTRSVLVPVGDGAVTVHFYDASTTAQTCIVLAHGAGADQNHPFMIGRALAWAERGVSVATFNFSYTEAKRRSPDPPARLLQCFSAVVRAVHVAWPDKKMAIGGKSMGGRMATMLATEGDTAIIGVVSLGYPLHPPKQPHKLRTAHLERLATPWLVVQGERDAFGTPDELRPYLPRTAKLHVVAGADHSFAVPKKLGCSADAVLREVDDVVCGWLKAR
jgi:predicted alpha/beta-hydrolase family hydrolase